jgi:hypothetical protein
VPLLTPSALLPPTQLVKLKACMAPTVAVAEAKLDLQSAVPWIAHNTVRLARCIYGSIDWTGTAEMLGDPGRLLPMYSRVETRRLNPSLDAKRTVFFNSSYRMRSVEAQW